MGKYIAMGFGFVGLLAFLEGDLLLGFICLIVGMLGLILQQKEEQPPSNG